VQQSVSTVRSEAFKHYVYTTPVVWLLVLVSWVIGHGFDTWAVQSKDYKDKIAICYFSHQSHNINE